MKNLFPLNHTALEDRAEIIDTVLRFGYAMDTKNWPLLRECLADQLDTDYTALRGEARNIISADDFVALRTKDHSNMRTQHMITNQLVSVHGEHAECTSCFLIHRIDPTRPEGENSFDTAGHYTHGFVRTPHGWRIERIRQTVLWSRGNREIHGALRRH